MNEVELRERLRQAVGESRYPADLSSRVEAQLKHSTLANHLRTGQDRTQSPWLVSLGRAGSLVGALLIVLLMASLVLGVHAWFMNTRPVTPAGPDPSVKRYQSMVSVDLQRLQDAPGYTCTYLDDANCLPEMALFNSALQQWLADLDRRPPARFATLDELMRQYLVAAISEQNAFITAYKAKDPNWVNLPYDDWRVADFGTDIVASSQGTTAQYRAEVRLDRTYLLACALCQRLVSQNQLSCPAGQTPSCVDEINAARLQVRVFMEDLVRVFAPDALTSKDAQLQADLVAADRQLDGMSAALSAGDQVALQGSHDALRQALNRVASDAADIAGSN
jgi:hypothetical protein